MSWLDAGYAHLKRDPLMAGLIERYQPTPLEKSQDLFKYIAGNIIYQQISTAAGNAIEKKFIALFEADQFPSPDQIAAKTPEDLRSAGLSRPKASYMLDLAQKVHSGELQIDHLHDLSDDEVRAHLTQVKGIGVWTADMVLMFALHRPDILPLGDLGIRNAFKKLLNREEHLSLAEMTEVAEAWRPYRTLACTYLWRIVDTKNG